MIRLVDRLARRRLLYRAPIPGGPDVLVIEMPPEMRGVGLPLGRFYPIIVENADEFAELDRFLEAVRAQAIAPSLLDHRPSALRSPHVVITRYDPPQVGWPWVSICRWPDGFTQAAAAQGLAMARGGYTMEMFEDPGSLEAHSEALLQSLAARHGVSVQLIAADALPAAGRA